MPVNKKLVFMGALGALGLLALGGAAGAAAAEAGGGPSGEDCIDDDMPPDMKQQVRELMKSKTLSPADLRQAAATMEMGGYEKAASCLEARANQVEAQRELDLVEKGGMPHKIRYGDIPYYMAEYYTGDGQRFKELGPLNPQIGKLFTENGRTNYTNWRPGVDILIPASWNPLDKPLPPPLQGGTSPKPPAEEKKDGWHAEADPNTPVEEGSVADQAYEEATDAISDWWSGDNVQDGVE